MAQAHFLRHLSGHTARAPCRLRGVEDRTSLPFPPLLSSDQGQTCLQPSSPFGGHERRWLEGWVNFLSSLLCFARCGQPGASRCLCSLLSGSSVSVPSFIPPVRRADISTAHPTSQPLSRPLSPLSSVAGHVFAFPALLFLGLCFPECC